MDDENILWAVQVHVLPMPVPWPQPAVMEILIAAPDEGAARQHALIAAAFLGRGIMVDQNGSMVYVEAVPEVSG